MPSKFTDETRRALLERFAAGVSQPDACRAMGLKEPTLKGWLIRGRRESSGSYSDFASDVDRVRREVRERPEPMDEDELLRVVSFAARRGSVQAMKLRWEMILADRSAAEADEGKTADPLAEFDELAERRVA